MKRAITVGLINIPTLLLHIITEIELGELNNLLLSRKKEKKASHASVEHHEQEDILSHNLSENMPRQISRIIHSLIISSLKQVNMWVKYTLLRNGMN